MRTGTMLRRAASAALFAGALPAVLAAQSLAYASAAGVPSDVERAEELHARASRLAAETGDLSRARMRRIASLHAKAADLFAADDPRGDECLMHAANLVHVANPERAARLTEKAAERALARGDVVGAAHRYVDVASIVARAAGQGEPLPEEWVPKARALADRALLLASSPLISPEDRDAIRSRIR